MNAQSTEVYDFCNKIFSLPNETVTEFLGGGITAFENIVFNIVYG